MSVTPLYGTEGQQLGYWLVQWRGGFKMFESKEDAEEYDSIMSSEEDR
jgi:hypothetical protein